MGLQKFKKEAELKVLRERSTDTITQLKDAEKRSLDLEKAFGEVTKQEDLDLLSPKVEEVEREIDGLVLERNKLDADIKTLEDEIAELDKALDSGTPENAMPETRSRSMTNNSNLTRSVYSMPGVIPLTRREQIAERLQNAEYRDFIKKFQTRGIENVAVTIPEIMLSPLLDMVQKKSVLYPLVRVIPVKGTAKIIISGSVPESVWTECCNPAKEINLSLTAVTLDCYMLSSYVPICDAMLDDSMFSLASYVEDCLATSIAKTLDKTILTSELTAAPQGILPLLTPVEILAANKVDDISQLLTYDAYLGEDIDIDDNSIYAVMNRKTYAERITKYSTSFNSAALLVNAASGKRTLPDGTPVKLTPYMPNNKVLIGDFSKYILCERESINISKSTEVRFLSNETVFKANARYDGKVVTNADKDASDAFVLFEFIDNGIAPTAAKTAKK